MLLICQPSQNNINMSVLSWGTYIIHLCGKGGGADEKGEGHLTACNSKTGILIVFIIDNNRVFPHSITLMFRRYHDASITVS